MPGIQFFFTLPDNDRSSRLPDVSPLATERTTTIWQDDVCTIRLFTHETYPYHTVVTDNAVMVFEGTVYNSRDKDTIDRLTVISRKYVLGEPVEDLIKRFVMESDGDFIVLMYDCQRHSMVLFNDQYARLPLFTCHDGTMFVATRRISYVLPAVPSLTIDTQSVAEYLAFEHYLGDKTAFREFRRIAPGALIHTEFDTSDNNKRVITRNGSTVPIVFDEIDREESREKCVSEYSQLFIESLAVRYEKVKEWNFVPTVDLSGGFDSRAVMMGLEHLDLEASYYTHQVITGDESVTARALADGYGRDLTVISADHILHITDMEQLVYATDLTMNAWTAVSCWNDYFKRREVSSPSAVFFTGLGGGFPRHPFKPVAGIRSLEQMTERHVLPSQVPLSVPASVMNLSPDAFITNVADHFRQYEEQMIQGRFKRYYFDYHMGVYAGDDRTRSIAWTISPFDSIPLMRYTLRSIPLEYMGFSFFIDFLKKLGEAGLKVPIRGLVVPLTMPLAGHVLDTRTVLRTSIRSRIMRNRQLFRLYGKLKQSKAPTADYTQGASLINVYLERSTACKRMFSREGINEQINGKMDIAGLYRILSIMMYLTQLEQLYGDAVTLE